MTSSHVVCATPLPADTGTGPRDRKTRAREQVMFVCLFGAAPSQQEENNYWEIKSCSNDRRTMVNAGLTAPPTSSVETGHDFDSRFRCTIATATPLGLTDQLGSFHNSVELLQSGPPPTKAHPRPVLP